MSGTIDVALILWNADVIDLVSFVLRRRSIRSCGIEPPDNTETVLDFVSSCAPAVVVYDLEPPYSRSAANALFLIDRLPHCSFVVTCADQARVMKAAPWLSSYAIYQKPYLLDEVADAIHSMIIRNRKEVERDLSFRNTAPSVECLPVYVQQNSAIPCGKR